MKVQYFKDTDTLYIEFRPAEIVESRDLDEDTVIDLDAKGKICAMTMEIEKRSLPTNNRWTFPFQMKPC